MPEKKVLIIGQGPSKSGEGKEPFNGKGSGEKLAALCGMSLAELKEKADLENLLFNFHGKKGKGDEFPADAAKLRAEVLRPTWVKYEYVVLLGENVAKAFDFDGERLKFIQVLEITAPASEQSPTLVAMVPHPSVVNRWYNDPANFEAAKKLFAMIFFSAPEALEVSDQAKKERAEYCTEYLRKFERCVQDWADLALILVEVEADKLFLEVGCETWDEWAKKAAPKSYRLCYTVKARYKSLKGAFTIEEMKQIPAQTADWASKARNISPAALSKPKVREALRLPKREALKAIQAAVPEEHVEVRHRIMLDLTDGQNNEFEDSYSAFKVLRDEKASREDFVEFCAAEFMESEYAEGRSVRQAWHAVNGGECAEEETEIGKAVAAV